MPIENYEDFIKLSLKLFVIQSSPISQGHIMHGLCKTKY